MKRLAAHKVVQAGCDKKLLFNLVLFTPLHKHDSPDWPTAQELFLPFHFTQVPAFFTELKPRAAMLLKFGVELRVHKKLFISASTEAQFI